MKNHIFISYNRSNDETFVLQLATDLKKQGVAVWVDQWDNQPGENWLQNIQQAIIDCSAFLAILSPGFISSQYCPRELSRATRLGRPLIPVLVEHVPAAEVPLQLETIHYTDFQEWQHSDTYQTRLNELLKVLQVEDAFERLNSQGLLYKRQGQYKQALASYNEALRLNPNYETAYHNRGVLYYEQGQYEQALASYNEALRLNPNYATAYHNRGVLYYEQGQYEQALADYNQAIRLNPNYAMAYNCRGLLYDEQGQYKQALADYSQAIRLNPNYADAYYSRGLLYQDQGQYEQALADYNQAIRLNPNYAEAYNNRGFLYQEQGQDEQALADYDEALRRNPNLPEAQENKAEILEKSKSKGGLFGLFKKKR